MQLYEKNIRQILNKHKECITEKYSAYPKHIPSDKNIVLTGNNLNEYRFKLFPAMTPYEWKFDKYKLIAYPSMWQAHLDWNKFDQLEYKNNVLAHHGAYTIEFVPTIKNVRTLLNAFKDISITSDASEIIQECIDDITKFDSHYSRLLKLRKNTKSINPEINNGFKSWSEEFPPFPHQRVTLEYIRQFPHCLILNEQGTGKTYPCIALIKELIKEKEISKALILCPKNISRSVWVEQIFKFSDLIPSVIDGTPKQRIHALNVVNANVFIIGYELASKMLEHLERNFLSKDTLLIADEITKIKNPSTERSKTLHRMSKICKRKIGLTGTPCTQNPSDVFSIMKFIDDGQTFGVSYSDFAGEYFKSSRYSQVAKINPGAIEKISNLMYLKALRYEKTEVQKYLPPKLYERRDVPMTADQEGIYRQMRDHLIAELEDGSISDAPVIITQLLRLTQITGGFLKTVIGEVKMFPGNPKLKICIEMCEEFVKDQGDSVIVWCRFIPEIKMVQFQLNKMGISCAPFYSKVKQQDRDIAVDNFQSGKIKVLVAQPASGGIGLDLFAANKVIFYSHIYSFHDRAQAEDRSHRHGSEKHKSIMYFDLCSTFRNGKVTIDHNILHILMQKKEIARLITKDRRMVRDLI